MTELLLAVVTAAPLLVYGEHGRLTKDHDLRRIEGGKLWNNLATTISSVYYDSPDMRLYKERIARHEGAQLFRIRWYGDSTPKNNELVFFELKTHHEKWINTFSVKERVDIRAKDVKTFLSRTQWGIHDAEVIVCAANPKLKGKDLEKAIDLLLTMHNLVIKRYLRPCVRSKYQRVAFQSPTSNKLRLTVDRNITMIDESSTPGGDWCLANSAITDSMITHVPFDVFEVKLAGSDMPESVESLLRQGVITEAAKFSKFLTGAAAFNTSTVDSLPYWAEHKAFAPLFAYDDPAQSKRGSSNLSAALPDIDHQSLVAVDTSTKSKTLSTEQNTDTPNKATAWLSLETLRHRGRDPQPRIAPKKAARVEPKSYFANERTFIQWISAGLLLMTISVFLLEFESSQPGFPLVKVGLALLGSSAAIIFYSLYSYIRRVKLLSRGENYGYVDHAGPFFLVAAIFAGLLAITGILVSIEMDERALARYNSFPIQEDNIRCIRHETIGVSMLEYQPSDVLVQDDRLLVPSLESIRAHDSTGILKTLATIPGADLEGLTSAYGKIYAISEVNSIISELLALDWTSDDLLEVVGRWEISTPRAEGIAFIPGTDKFYIAGDLVSGVDNFAERGVIDVYEVPNELSASSLKGNRLNSRMINGNLADSKISALQYFEGVLYVLHDNAKVVRAWDVLGGELLSEWKVPQYSKQWEGMALERREPQLRGGSGGQLFLHLTLDSPPQTWSLAVQEGRQRGEIVLPSCALA